MIRHVHITVMAGHALRHANRALDLRDEQDSPRSLSCWEPHPDAYSTFSDDDVGRSISHTTSSELPPGQMAHLGPEDHDSARLVRFFSLPDGILVRNMFLYANGKSDISLLTFGTLFVAPLAWTYMPILRPLD